VKRLALLLVVGTLLAACSGQQGTPTQEPTKPTDPTTIDNNQPDPPEAASQQPELAFGRSGSVGGATVTVQAPYWGKPPDYGTEEGFELAVFKVKWEATRDRVVTPTFTVTMDGGEEFTRNPSFASNGAIQTSPIWEGDQLILTELDTGDWVNGQVAFVLPRERGTLYVKGDEGAPVLAYRFGPDSTGSLPSGYGSKIINRPPDPAAETQALNERYAVWNQLVAEANEDVRVAKLRWDNEELFDYLNFWMHDEIVEERSYPYPFTGNPDAAQGVLFETASPLMPTGSSHRDVCRLNEPGQVYKGDAGDHTRYYWGWVTCRGQIETIHAKLRYFRDAEGIDHAMVQLLKTPPQGG
jgi:hypothetical protein